MLQPILDYSAAKELPDKYQLEKKPKLKGIFQTHLKCPYCGLATKMMYSREYKQTWTELWRRVLRADRRGKAEIYACECGWWTIFDDYQEFYKCPEAGWDNWLEKTKYSILKQFDPTDIKAPVDELIKYAAKNPSVLREINPTKMEKLVGDTIGYERKCQVKHCGRTGDGGIDLYILDNDDPMLVQVKRRTKASTESVTTVRELLGATLLKEGNRAYIVTTAAKFSAAAKKAATDSVGLGLLTEFELIDFDRFANILKLVSNDSEQPWQKFGINLLPCSYSIFDQ